VAVAVRVAHRGLRILRTVAITAAVAFAVLAWTTRSSNPNVLRALRDSGAVRSVLTLLRSPNGELLGVRDNRVNVLLLGIGGEGHEGPNLTDTIIIASIEPSTHRVALTSIPRDLAVPLPDGRTQKMNAINAFAEAAETGSGGAATREALERVVGISIPYHLRVDFAGFAGLIDELGGVTVDVERTLDDPEYPIEGKEAAPWAERFEHLVIAQGPQHFDGATALKYVRSRHARGVEGSDFARARRQQRLLLAVRDRALARDVLTNPRRALALLEAWRTHVDTNMSPPELFALTKFAPDIAGTDVAHTVFTDAPDGELTAALVSGVYVLLPREGTFDRIQSIVRSTFNRPIAPRAAPERLAVEIWNGTDVSGLAARTADTLAAEGLRVAAVRNAPVRNVTQTMIYYRSDVSPDLLERLRIALHAETSTAFPALTTDVAHPDLLIVLGTSSAQLGMAGGNGTPPRI
jgi:LCP family protein required for cell wall assembly